MIGATVLVLPLWRLMRCAWEGRVRRARARAALAKLSPSIEGANEGAPVTIEGTLEAEGLCPRFVDGHAAATRPPPPPPELSAAIAEGVQKANDTTWEVDAAALEKILGNPRELARGARIVPCIKDGAPNGFKLYAIRPRSCSRGSAPSSTSTVRSFPK